MQRLLCQRAHFTSVNYQLTLSSRDRKLMKSAHSFTFSKLDKLLSTIPANFLYLASLASKLVAAALPTRRRCSGVVRPFAAELISSAYATSLVAEADDDARDRPGSISFASRLCDVGRRRPRVGEPGRDEVDEWGEEGDPVFIVGTASIMIAFPVSSTIIATRAAMTLEDGRMCVSC